MARKDRECTIMDLIDTRMKLMCRLEHLKVSYDETNDFHVRRVLSKCISVYDNEIDYINTEIKHV